MNAQLIDYYKQIDQFLFTKINQDWAFPFGDFYFPAITDYHQTATFLYMVMPALIVMVLLKYKMKGVKFLITLAMAVILTDMVSFRIVKHMVQRARPAHSGIHVVLRVEDSGGTSFPSSHAANMFAAASVTFFFFPFWGILLFIYAASVAYSRVYVGVHYPSDVVAGALLGIFISMVLLYVVKPFLAKKEKKESRFKFN